MKPGYLLAGVDPGKKFGVAFAYENNIITYGGTLSETFAPFYGIEAIEVVQYLVDKINVPTFATRYALVEGAAYAAHYGQDLLSQVRFGFAYGLYLKNFKINFIPPHSARKSAFGSAKITGKDLWLRMNANAADAVGILLSVTTADNYSPWLKPKKRGAQNE